MTTSEFGLPRIPSSLPYAEWQLEYQDVLLETDTEKQAERVAEAEAAIFNRLQQLSHTQDGQAERQAIEDAINTLRVMKRESLNFPDWESGSGGV